MPLPQSLRIADDRSDLRLFNNAMQPFVGQSRIERDVARARAQNCQHRHHSINTGRQADADALPMLMRSLCQAPGQSQTASLQQLVTERLALFAQRYPVRVDLHQAVNPFNQ